MSPRHILRAAIQRPLLYVAMENWYLVYTTIRNRSLQVVRLFNQTDQA